MSETQFLGYKHIKRQSFGQHYGEMTFNPAKNQKVRCVGDWKTFFQGSIINETH